MTRASGQLQESPHSESGPPRGRDRLANSELLDPDVPASPQSFACQPDEECLLRWGFGGLARIGTNGAVRAQRALAWEDGWGGPTRRGLGAMVRRDRVPLRSLVVPYRPLARVRPGEPAARSSARPRLRLGVGWPKVHFSGDGVLLAAWGDEFKSETLGDRVWVRRFAVDEN